jgi:hypothetical protein
VISAFAPVKVNFGGQKFRIKSGKSVAEIGAYVIGKGGLKKQNAQFLGRSCRCEVAGPTGLEPATSGVTGRLGKSAHISANSRPHLAVFPSITDCPKNVRLET